MTPYFRDSGLVIYHGDCRDVLASIDTAPVDLVLTDPPYGISHKPKALDGQKATWDGNKIEGDDSVGLRDSVLQPFPNVIAFGAWRQPPLPKAHTAVIWDKGPAAGGMNFHAPWRMNWEIIFVRGRGFQGPMDLGIITNRWIPTWQSHGKVHQHQKPLTLMTYLLSRAPFAKLVLDPFMGSGTTLRAAKDAGIAAIGIEIEERYCEIAAKRLAQGVLFGADRESASGS